MEYFQSLSDIASCFFRTDSFDLGILQHMTRNILYFLVLMHLVSCGKDNDVDDSGNDNGNENISLPTINENVLCNEALYSEPFPDSLLDISDMSYSPSDATAFYRELSARRYPFGATLIDEGKLYTAQDCVGLFNSGVARFDQALGRVSTIVHECGHFWSFREEDFSNALFNIAPGITLTCQNGDSEDRFGKTFAKSLIRQDDESAKRPPCDESSGPCDFYAEVYLDGNAFDNSFEGGDQGFNMIVEETIQYVNSLASEYGVRDRFTNFSTSARDGILTHLWYMQRYLRMARTTLAFDYPDAYAAIAEDECYRHAILNTWNRAWFYLNLSEGTPGLELDAGLIDLVLQDHLLEEIDRLKELEGC